MTHKYKLGTRWYSAKYSETITVLWTTQHIIRIRITGEQYRSKYSWAPDRLENYLYYGQFLPE